MIIKKNDVAEYENKSEMLLITNTVIINSIYSSWGYAGVMKCKLQDYLQAPNIFTFLRIK